MRPKRMLSGCGCMGNDKSLLKSLGFLGKPLQKYIKADGVISNCLKVSDLNTITEETPNLFDGLKQLIVALGLDTDVAKQTKIFQLDGSVVVGSKGFTADEILHVIDRFLGLATNNQILSSMEKGEFAQLSNSKSNISLGNYLDKILGYLEQEKGKSLLQARIVERNRKKEAFTKELQDYLGWNPNTQTYEKSTNPRDFFEYFLEKYGLDNFRFGIDFYGKVNPISYEGKVYDPLLFQTLIGMSLSYGAASGVLSTQDIKKWAGEIAKATDENRARRFPSLSNATAIDITRNTLGMKTSTKVILGLGGVSALGMLIYRLSNKS